MYSQRWELRVAVAVAVVVSLTNDSSAEQHIGTANPLYTYASKYKYTYTYSTYLYCDSVVPLIRRSRRRQHKPSCARTSSIIWHLPQPAIVWRWRGGDGTRDYVCTKSSRCKRACKNARTLDAVYQARCVSRSNSETLFQPAPQIIQPDRQREKKSEREMERKRCAELRTPKTVATGY